MPRTFRTFIWPVISPVLLWFLLYEAIILFVYIVAEDPREILDKDFAWINQIHIVICMPIFLRKWIKIRKSILLPIERTNSLKAGTTLLVFAFATALFFINASSLVVFEVGNIFPTTRSDMRIFYNVALFAQFFSMVVLVPIVEELMFRGVILNRFLGIAPTWLAVLISGIFFALLHDGIHALEIAFTSLTGIWLALLYVRFRNLWLCIIAHIVHNFLATNTVVLTLVDSMASSFPVLSIALPIIAMLGIGALLIFKCPPAIMPEKPFEDENKRKPYLRAGVRK